MIVIHSKAYLVSPWCQKEVGQFVAQEVEQRSGAGSRIFVVELSNVERAPAARKV